MEIDPLARAGDARDFLSDSATAFAEDLMPGLQRGLRSTRSRFSGGSIRSGGAQEAEENAFTRLFADPLQNRISQLSTQALGFGERDADRESGQAFNVLEGERGQNRFFAGLNQRDRQFGEEMDFRRLQERNRQRQLEERRKQERRSGIGGLLGGVAGSLLGPAGSAIGSKLGGFVEGLF